MTSSKAISSWSFVPFFRLYILVMDMNRTVKEILLDALQELLEDQLKAFKWRLKNTKHYERKIPAAKLEKADVIDVVDCMCHFYGESKAPTVCISVLESINLKDVADDLKKAVENDQPEASLEEDVEHQPKRQKTASETEYRLEYRNYIKKTFRVMKDPNSLLGECVPLMERYSELIILDKHRPEKDRKHEIRTLGSRHDKIMRNHCSITIQKLLQPDESGFIPDVVVLQGAAGIGKTMTARRIMLDWACGELYQDLFDYVFYIHCRGMNLGTEEKSMADIILAQGANEDAIKGMLRNPQKLLFVIDGFDELRFSIDQPEDCLCSDPRKKASLSVLLSSLFRKRLLPKSCLVITTRPTALLKLRLLLETETLSVRYAEILGFSPEDRKEYFHKFFQNEEQARKALQVVEQNEILFTMCFVPIVCWIICTVMKQQLDRGEDLVQTSNTVTAVYMLYLSSLFKSSKTHGKRLVETNLRGLCSLAADGIWKQEILFGEEEIQKYGLDQEDSLPLFLNENIFKRDIECICAYSFLHLSFQEFFAALSYVLEEENEALNPEKPNCDVKAVLDSYRTSRPDLALTVRFLFGLLNEEERMRNLKEKFGWKMSPKIKELLLQWVKNTTKTKIVRISERNPELFALLYELQDEDFVKSSLDTVTEVELNASSFSEIDVVNLSFCLNYCHNLEVLNVEHYEYKHNVFEGDDHYPDEGEGELLRQPQLYGKIGKQEPVKHFCEAVMYWSSKLREIRLYNCNLTAGCYEELSRVLVTSQTLVKLDLSRNKLGHSSTKRLCGALGDPGCKLQTLTLENCQITAASCGDLSSVLRTNQNLIELNLGYNRLEDSGLKFLCEGLNHSNCKLQSIRLENCNIKAGSGGALTTHLNVQRALSSALSTNQNLTKLQLSGNKLRDSGLKFLCEGLKHPNCRLKSVGLAECDLTAACCEDLSSVLRSNHFLEELDLSSNELEDRGMALFWGALEHPNCNLQKLQ
ncbi:hypothetical protein lerEdw1_020683 [Lerista edwardsae]|nr:hypothetical protein lerEdw1_020683 [Lerista edwardsae]